MPERVETTWAMTRIGDYIESVKDASLWKVTHEITKPDGRHLGLTMADGRNRHIYPASMGQRVTVLLYAGSEDPRQRLDRAVEVVKAELGGEVIAEERNNLWTHPPYHVLEASLTVLRAHLVRFHGEETTDDVALKDWVINTHRILHDQGADHTHEERV